MESAGLAVGVVGLATTFDAVLKCFDYIHFAKNIGRDYENCSLKLENARLRLSRWDEAVGLNQVDVVATSFRNTRLSEADEAQAKRLFLAILEEINRIKGIETKFAKSQRIESRDEELLHPARDLSSGGFFVREQIRKIIKRRQNNLHRVLDSTKWAIYDRNHFKEMIDNISEMTKELHELFPIDIEEEKALVDGETLALSRNLQLLSSAIKGQDRALTSALDSLLKPVTERVENTVHGGNVGVMSAHRSTISQQFS